ncbi:hypothetical protein Tco_0326715 [Tanacetum coccineum]
MCQNTPPFVLLLRVPYHGNCMDLGFSTIYYVAVILFGPYSSVPDNWGTMPSDSKNELSLRTFSVMNETDGSGDAEGLVLVFFGLSFSSSSLSAGSSSWESLCFLGWIVTVLIEPW